jgi:Tfp pilus assembly protein PilV
VNKSRGVGIPTERCTHAAALRPLPDPALRTSPDPALRSAAGLSLIEAVVAGAIVAVAALVLVSLTYALMGMGRHNAETLQAQTALSERVSLDPAATVRPPEPLTITLTSGGGSGTATFDISAVQSTYEVDGRQLGTFAPASPPTP